MDALGEFSRKPPFIICYFLLLVSTSLTFIVCFYIVSCFVVSLFLTWVFFFVILVQLLGCNSLYFSFYFTFHRLFLFTFESKGSQTKNYKGAGHFQIGKHVPLARHGREQEVSHQNFFSIFSRMKISVPQILQLNTDYQNNRSPCAKQIVVEYFFGRIRKIYC